MKELMEYRKSLIDRLERAADEFAGACLKVEDVFAPLPESAWNIHQVAVHVRDVDTLVYGSRARRTAADDNPEFQSFDGEAYLAEHYSVSEPLEKILEELRENVKQHVRFLRELPTEAWSRQSRHATLGHGFTLQTWVERELAHIEEHMPAVNK